MVWGGLPQRIPTVNLCLAKGRVFRCLGRKGGNTWKVSRFCQPSTHPGFNVREQILSLRPANRSGRWRWTVGCVLVVCWLCVGCTLVVRWLCVGCVLVMCWLCVGCVLVVCLDAAWEPYAQEESRRERTESGSQRCKTGRFYCSRGTVSFYPRASPLSVCGLSVYGARLSRVRFDLGFSSATGSVVWEA